METIQLRNATSTKNYNLVRHTGVGPFIKMSNGYLPLTLETTTGDLQLKVVRGGKTYRAVDFIQTNLSYNESYKNVNSYSDTSYTGVGSTFGGTTIRGEVTSTSSRVTTYGATNATDYHATEVYYVLDDETFSYTGSFLVTTSNSNGQTGTYSSGTTETTSSTSQGQLRISFFTNQTEETESVTQTVYSSGSDSIPYETVENTWCWGTIHSHSFEGNQSKAFIEQYETRQTNMTWIKTDNTTSYANSGYRSTVNNAKMIRTWL